MNTLLRVALLATLMLACAEVRDAGNAADGGDTVDESACRSCHRSNADPMPPNSYGHTALAHTAHTTPDAPLAQTCEACHVVPTSVDSNGHIDGDGRAEVTFGTFSRTDGATPGYDYKTRRCGGVYCHGVTLGGGDLTTPTWNNDDAPATCGACHGLPPPAPHPAAGRCSDCHAPVVDEHGQIARPDLHGDGEVTVAPSSCHACHGNESNAAPPQGLHGEISATAPAVGAHQAHLDGSSIAAALPCKTCHTVPFEMDASGHIDGDDRAEVRFDTSAFVDGAQPSYDPATHTCSGVYCHGATLSGGAHTVPGWTQSEAVAACDACHGMPPAPPRHPAANQCDLCHGAVVDAEGRIADPNRHIDGRVDVVDQHCNSCHGSETNAAPPRGLDGELAISDPAVGAHQAHLAGSELAAAFACTVCHVFPSGGVDSPGHIDDGDRRAEVVFQQLAVADGATPRYDRQTNTCSDVYCHGTTLATTGGGAATVPLWTSADGTFGECGSCHGAPPPEPHPAMTDCSMCHHATMESAGVFVEGGGHLNGHIDF